MKIAFVTISHKSITHASTGGLETFAMYLVRTLKKQGADVTVFTAQETDLGIFGTELSPVFSLSDLAKSEGENLESKSFTLNYALFQYAGLKKALDSGNFDIIHFSCAQWYVPFLLAGPNDKIVTTVHVNNLRPSVLEYVLKLSSVPYIANISDSSSLPFLPYTKRKTVLNGIDTDQLEYIETPENYVAWMGRIAPVKGLKDAVLAAKAADIELKASGPVDFPQYYEADVAPFLDGKRTVQGPLNPGEKNGFLGLAKAVLMPVTWDEPFGLVAVEAMACGTPVIAYARGGLKEIIEDGVTGFLVEPERGVDGLVDAIKRVGEIDRAKCRKRVEEHFSADIMAMKYFEYYREICQ